MGVYNNGLSLFVFNSLLLNTLGMVKFMEEENAASKEEEEHKILVLHLGLTKPNLGTMTFK